MTTTEVMHPQGMLSPTDIEYREIIVAAGNRVTAAIARHKKTQKDADLLRMLVLIRLYNKVNFEAEKAVVGKGCDLDSLIASMTVAAQKCGRKKR